MLRKIRLTAAILAGLAAPALAQTTSPATPAPARTPPPATMAPPAATRPAAPATPAPAAATPTPSRATAMPAAASRKIDINAASETELASMRGVGPVTAKAIVAGRPWDDLNDLVKKKAMTQAAFDGNKDKLALANINTSSVSDMSKTLPGVGDATARKIAEGRPYAKPDDLVGKKILTQGGYDKLKDLITY